MHCSKQSCAQLPPAENNRLHCLVLHPGKLSVNTSRLEEFSCPVCWERNACFDTEAKYQKLSVQLHFKTWLNSVFHFLLKSWQQTTSFGHTFVSKDVVDKQSIHTFKRHCACGHQAVFRCFGRHIIRIIHVVSRVMLCH